MCIYGGFLDFSSLCFVESLSYPAIMPVLPNWSASKAWQVLSPLKPNILTKWSSSSHLCPELVNQQNMASIIKKHTILTKRLLVATTVSSGMNTVNEALVYWPLLGYTFRFTILARAIPPPSWSSALPMYMANHSQRVKEGFFKVYLLLESLI